MLLADANKTTQVICSFCHTFLGFLSLYLSIYDKRNEMVRKIDRHPGSTYKGTRASPISQAIKRRERRLTQAIGKTIDELTRFTKQRLRDTRKQHNSRSSLIETFTWDSYMGFLHGSGIKKHRKAATPI